MSRRSWTITRGPGTRNWPRTSIANCAVSCSRLPSVLADTTSSKPTSGGPASNASPITSSSELWAIVCASSSSGTIAAIPTTAWSARECALRCQAGIQLGTNEDQDGSGQQDDRVVAAQTEGARAAGQHESAQG